MHYGKGKEWNTDREENHAAVTSNNGRGAGTASVLCWLLGAGLWHGDRQSLGDLSKRSWPPGSQSIPLTHRGEDQQATWVLWTTLFTYFKKMFIIYRLLKTYAGPNTSINRRKNNNEKEQELLDCKISAIRKDRAAMVNGKHINQQQDLWLVKLFTGLCIVGWYLATVCDIVKETTQQIQRLYL